MKITGTPLRVLIADGSRDFLDVARAWLEQHSCVRDVRAVHTGTAALDAAARGEVDLVLLDVKLPDMDGFEATRRIKSMADPPLVVLLVLFDYQAVREEAATAGADACVDKSALTRNLDPVLPGFMERAARRREPRKPASPS